MMYFVMIQGNEIDAKNKRNNAVFTQKGRYIIIVPLFGSIIPRADCVCSSIVSVDGIDFSITVAI